MSSDPNKQVARAVGVVAAGLVGLGAAIGAFLSCLWFRHDPSRPY